MDRSGMHLKLHFLEHIVAYKHDVMDYNPQHSFHNYINCTSVSQSHKIPIYTVYTDSSHDSFEK